MIDTKRYISFVILGVLCLLSTVSMGQLAEPSQLSAGKLKKIALNAERYGDKYTALAYYEYYAKKKGDDASVQYHLGELQESLRDYKGASESYLRAYELNDKDPQGLYDHIRMVKMTGAIDSAKAKYENFNDILRKKRYSSTWRRVLKTEIASCDTALGLMADSLDVEIKNLGANVNGPHAEFSPMPFGDSVLVYGALKENEIKYYRLDSATTRRRFYISTKEDEVWNEAQLWDVPFNQGEKHLVNGSYSADGSLFVFTRCFENWKNEMTCELWQVEIENDQWGTPERLPDNINLEETIITQPALAFDQRKEQHILYYSSNQDRGQGGMDIWYTYFDKRRKEWRPPRNLGRRVNGEGDEITPFYNDAEKKLYYSSSSFTGMGGLDIYSSRGEIKRFAKPINVGYPINSSVDDFYFALRDDRESGFFVSNRAGGYQMINETCCDDIYEFRRLDIIHIEMEGFVMNVEDEEYLRGDGDKLDSDAFSTDMLDGVEVSIFMLEDGNEVLMDKMTTGGDGKFFVDFEPGKEYKVVLARDGFYSNHIEIDTRDYTESVLLVQNVGLSEISDGSVVLENILYDFNSAELTSESKATIDKGIYSTLIENPGLVVEISSHTDNKGEKAYNLNLSQDRAQSVVDYLTGKGINSDRMIPKGYGETQPIAENANPDGSDNPDGRALNRRTEFKILDNKVVEEEDLYED